MRHIALSFFLIFILFLGLLLAFYFKPESEQTVQKKIDSEKLASRLNELKTLLVTIDESNITAQLQRVNDFFNLLPYETDPVTWDKDDYWASRKEFLGVGQGDCEDYAIAKYFTLRQLGFTNDQLFLTYVKASQTRMPHIVLTYYAHPEATPLVLDSINPNVLPATRRRDLKPIFNFNGDRIYMAKQRGLGRELPQGKIDLDKWTKLMDKVEEGK